MPKLCYGSFEENLRAHIVPEMTKLDLANILLPSPAFEVAPDGSLDDMRRANFLDSTAVTRICTGERPLPPILREYYAKPNALDYVKDALTKDIMPRILGSDKATLLKDILRLVRLDDSLPEEAKAYFENLASLEHLGDFLVEVYLRAINSREEGFKTVTNLPVRNRSFQGRKQMLSEIRECFRSGVHVQGLYGIGGVGKTQLALQYAHAYLDCYETVWWINAENKTALHSSVLGLLSAQKCLLKGKDPESIQRAFLKYLNSHSGWLLIYNNAEYGTPEEYETLSAYFPQEPKGHILLTTRCKDAFGGALHREVPVFCENDAVTFLQRRSNQIDSVGAAKVAQRLGYLPLALEYAAAYIRETPGVDYMSYNRKLEHYGVKVLDRKVGRQAYKHTVRQAFHITLDRILEDAGTSLVARGAQQFLSMCAFLAPEGIELDVFVRYGNGLPEPIRSVLADELDRDELLRNLTRYSLVQIDRGAMNIHRLLQEVLRDELEPDVRIYWINYVYGVFYSIFYSQRELSANKLRPILSSSVPHIQSILYRYVQQKRDGSEELPDSIMVAKEYFSWTALLVTDTRQLEGQALMDACRCDVSVFHEAVGFYDTLPGEKPVYLAYTLMLLAQTHEKLGEVDAARDTYIRALEVLDEAVCGLPEQLTAAQAGKLPGLYRTEVFQLASDICAAVGSSNMICSCQKLLWGNLGSLVKIVQKEMCCFPRKEEAGSYWETAMFMKIFSNQVANCTQRAFILRLHAPENWKGARGWRLQEGPFGFFFPSAEEECEPLGHIMDGFDILLERDSGAGLAQKLDGPWRTLAFPADVQTEHDMLNALMHINTSELGISGKRSLYAAICTLAGHLQREDIIFDYGRRLTTLTGQKSSR